MERNIFLALESCSKKLGFFVLGIFVTTAWLMSCSTPKQATTYSMPVNKMAVVSNDSAFTDLLQVPFDAKGVNVTVSMQFDEPENILTLTVKGSRTVFVFREDTYYNKVFYKKFLGHRYMKPEKLSYPVLMQPDMRIMLSKQVYKSFVAPKNKHLFNKWLGETSANLTVIQPSTESNNPVEATLICDSIVQRFRVQPDANEASVTLRNLLVIDRYSKKTFPAASVAGSKKSSGKVKWMLTNDNDINTTYHIKLKRNPCFGLDAQKDSTLQRLFDVTNAYHNLINSCPTGVVETKAAQQIFRQHKQFLRSKYIESTDSSACPDVEANIKEYNSYVDSIRNAKCAYVPPIDQTAEGSKVLGSGVSPRVLLDAARRLDNMVSQFVITSDVAQIHDLIQGGQELIRLTYRNIAEKGIYNDDQRAALKEFKKAEQYFNRVVLKQ